jgi:DNA invertase Pin-like site-specific DNA recombinase
MALIGYARVSTAEQDTALQTDALRKAGCERVFEDTASGAKADRPGLADALAYLRDGDVLAVWRLDRLRRSMPHLIETIGALEARRRLPFSDGSHRHHHARRAAHLPRVRRAGPVRAT